MRMPAGMWYRLLLLGVPLAGAGPAEPPAINDARKNYALVTKYDAHFGHKNLYFAMAVGGTLFDTMCGTSKSGMDKQGLSESTGPFNGYVGSTGNPCSGVYGGWRNTNTIYSLDTNACNNLPRGMDGNPSCYGWSVNANKDVHITGAHSQD